jgi:hypothetical protein
MCYLQPCRISGLRDELRKRVVGSTAAASLNRVFVMWSCSTRTQLIQRETLPVASNENGFVFLNSSFSYFSFFKSFVYQ